MEDARSGKIIRKDLKDNTFLVARVGQIQPKETNSVQEQINQKNFKKPMLETIAFYLLPALYSTFSIIYVLIFASV